MLRQFLPAEMQGNAVELEIDADTTPYQIIDQYNIPREYAHLIMINGVYVEPESRDKPVFRQGDVFAVWPPVAGGQN